MSAACAWACETIAGDCSSAERSSCSMRAPSPVLVGLSISFRRASAWESWLDMVTAAASRDSTCSRASRNWRSRPLMSSSTCARSYPRITTGKRGCSSTMSCSLELTGTLTPTSVSLAPNYGGCLCVISPANFTLGMRNRRKGCNYRNLITAPCANRTRGVGKVIRRILAIVLIVLGLGTIGAAIASATVWKPDSTVTVPLPSEPEVNYVISEPGVLNIVNKTVKVRAVAQDGESPVFLGMGRTEDVEAWVAESDHGAITGLPTWDSLGYQKIDGVEPEAEDEDGEEAAEEEPEAANPADSDMWVEQVNGVGELTYTWEEVPGQWSMIVATDGASPAPMVEFTWEREVPTPALIPGILVGSVLTILGFLLLALDVLARRKVRAEAAEAEADDDVEAEEVTDSDELEVVDADPEETSPDETSPEETSPEEIMAGVEAATQEPEPLIATTEFEYVKAPEAPATEEYPHRLESDAPEEEDRPLTRREIRERERARERAAALGLDSA